MIVLTKNIYICEKCLSRFNNAHSAELCEASELPEIGRIREGDSVMVLGKKTKVKKIKIVPSSMATIVDSVSKYEAEKLIQKNTKNKHRILAILNDSIFIGFGSDGCYSSSFFGDSIEILHDDSDLYYNFCIENPAKYMDIQDIAQTFMYP